MEYESREPVTFRSYMCQEADKKKKPEKTEGDGRIAEDKSKHKGDWGPHKPQKEQPKDRDKDKFKPWQKPQ